MANSHHDTTLYPLSGESYEESAASHQASGVAADEMSVDTMDASSRDDSMDGVELEPSAQVSRINNILNKHSVPKKKGETWYIIDAKWFASFLDCGAPGPIDNNPIVSPMEDEDSKVHLKDNLQEKADYELVPEEAWKLLFGW